MRLYRVDGRLPIHISGISGCWFSPDPVYVYDHYYRPHTVWTYVDMPDEEAAQYTYEKVRETAEGKDLFGVEGKDYILPPAWVQRRITLDGPPEDAVSTNRVHAPLRPLPLTEITSNVAKVGRVLDYDSVSGSVTVVAKIVDGSATVVTKNRKLPGECIIQVVPIRQVVRHPHDGTLTSQQTST